MLGQDTKKNNFRSPFEINASFGLSSLSGDVNSQVFRNSNYSLGIRNGVNTIWSLEAKINYSRSFGLDVFPSFGLEDISPSIFQGYDISNPYFYAFKNVYSSLEINSLFELSNLGFKMNPNINYYIGIGAGMGNSNTTLNIRDDQGQVYQNLIGISSFGNLNDPNTQEGRDNITKLVVEYYDDTYETPGPKRSGQFRLGDETNVFVHAALTFGVSYRLNRKLNIGFEYQNKFIGSDLLDGKDQLHGGENDNNDMLQILSLKVAYNLNGKSGKEPKYWTNDWNSISNRIDTLEASIPLLLEDSDGDGVIDRLDREPNTLGDCPVDLHGILLDSDRDGIPDCQDSSPYGKDTYDSSQKQFQSDDLRLELKNVHEDLRNLRDSISSLHSVLQSFSARNTLYNRKSIYFDRGFSSLSNDDIKTIFELSEYLKHHSNSRLIVNGFASEEGDDDQNMVLSSKRTNTVKSILLNVFQIGSERITSTSFGSTQKVYIGNSDKYNYLDRRVDLIIEEN